MNPSAAILLLWVTAVMNIGETDGLRCYQCTSRIDPDCLEVLEKDPVRQIRLAQCPSIKTIDPRWLWPAKQGRSSQNPGDRFIRDCPTDKDYKFCRRIYQKVRGTVTVIRSCGFIKDPIECRETFPKPDCKAIGQVLIDC